jgi:hypothetical protein
MAMPRPAYDEARLRARYHVQIELAHATVGETPAHVPVIGRVRRIFRGDDCLRLGDEVHFSVAVCRPGDDLAPGGHQWMYVRHLERATYMEAFLDGTPPECQVARSQCFVIPALSNAPWKLVPTEEEVAVAWAAFRGQNLRRGAFTTKLRSASKWLRWLAAHFHQLPLVVAFLAKPRRRHGEAEKGTS